MPVLNCFSECVSSNKGSAGPLCGVPSHVKDAQVNRQLHDAANLCRKLTKLLNTSIDQGECYHAGVNVVFSIASIVFDTVVK